jgi:NADPH:quinone reductase-like Zn-dependent oxidoreductase
MAKTFQAVQFHAYGGPEVLKLEELPVPAPGEGEVLIKVSFAGVNPIDWKLRSGAYHAFMPVTFPAKPGIDVSGVIEEVGPGVSTWKKGDAVLGTARGSYAEFALAKASDVVAKPASLSFEDAASLPVGALTAWQLVEEAGVSSGQRVLVQGAAGGVGLFALQFAKLRGAHVVGSASAANLDFIKSLGADEVLDYSKGPLALKNLDVVIDTVGGGALDGAYALLKKGGVVVTPAGQPSADKAKALGITAKGVNRGPITVLSVIADLVAAKKVVTAIQKVFPLAQAAQAQTLSQGGHGRGRILIKL